MPEGVGKPIVITPKTVADNVSDTSPNGMMSQLSNLVPNPIGTDQWVPRPAATVLTGTAAAFSPGFVSCMIVVGNYVYGMVSSALNPGHDQPFAYNIVTGLYTAISGITSSNVPTSPPTSGAWTPPTIDIIGVYVVVTHPGFNGSGNGFFGWINISDIGAPTWSSGNTATNALPAVPTYVKQFFNRACFVVSPPNQQPATYHTDAENPTSAAQPYILTYGDAAPIVALGVLGLQNMFGGIVHALMVFKQNNDNIYQVTGDFAPDGSLGSVVVNSLEIASTTAGPLAVCATPRGLAFMSPDGLRIIDWSSHITDPVGLAGTGITQAFTESLTPSRMVMACNGQSIRITTQNNAINGQPQQEWVYDLELKKWHGPHSFPWSMIIPYGFSYIGAGPMPGNVAPITGLWKSDIIPNTQSQYTENGAQLTWTFATSLIANQSMFEQAVELTTIGVSADAVAQGFTCAWTDQNNASVDVCVINPPVAGSSLWGSMVWGTGIWGSGPVGLGQIQIPWNLPIVFDRGIISVMGMSAQGITLGTIRMDVETLSYIVQATAS